MVFLKMNLSVLNTVFDSKWGDYRPATGTGVHGSHGHHQICVIFYPITCEIRGVPLLSTTLRETYVSKTAK